MFVFGIDQWVWTKDTLLICTDSLLLLISGGAHSQTSPMISLITV